MNKVAADFSASSDILLPDLLALSDQAVRIAERAFDAARAGLAAEVVIDNRVSGAALEAHQFEAHGLSWLATYAECLRQLTGWARRLTDAGAFGEVEALILQIGTGEYLNHILCGIPMSQTEIIRLADLGVDASTLKTDDDGIARLLAAGNSPAARARLVTLIRERGAAPGVGAFGLDDEYDMIRDQFRRFSDERVVPFAHEWHLKDELIPLSLIEEMGELGVFGLTIPEEFGGFGMSKTAMCVVSEELSRGYIGVGSLGTRSEIAAELILCGGTAEQKSDWLPRIASAEILPTAVFTEP